MSKSRLIRHENLKNNLAYFQSLMFNSNHRVKTKRNFDPKTLKKKCQVLILKRKDWTIKIFIIC